MRASLQKMCIGGRGSRERLEIDHKGALTSAPRAASLGAASRKSVCSGLVPEGSGQGRALGPFARATEMRMIRIPTRGRKLRQRDEPGLVVIVGHE